MFQRHSASLQCLQKDSQIQCGDRVALMIFTLGSQNLPGAGSTASGNLTVLSAGARFDDATEG
jgi:hypothetical protein